MGFVPIFLALSAFIFLWAIVNYHSLSNHFKLVNQLEAKLKQLKQNIHTEVKQLESCCMPEFEARLEHILHQVKKDDDIHSLEQEFESFNKSYEEAYKDEATAIQEVIRKDLTKDFSQLVSAKQEYLAAVKSYNKIVAQMPTVLLARIFGFRKITI